jgi:hypothetical protein
MTVDWDAVGAIASVIGALITLGIAWMVHDYTVRRDKASIIHEMWKQQQEWNLTAASSPAHAAAVEQMVYGLPPKSDEERLALNACMFFFINRINHIYDAYSLGILKWAEFEQEAKSTIPLIAGQKELLHALLDHRGYDPKFATVVKDLVRDIPVTGSVNVFERRAPQA